MGIRELYPWLPALTALFTLIAMTIRCLTLLVGLMAVLSKAYSSDRSEIFREFARAASSRRSIVKLAGYESDSRVTGEKPSTRA